MMEKLTTKDLVDALVEKTGGARQEMEGLVREFSEVVTTGLEADGEVRVRGLGTFKLKRVARRVGRNLKTGEQIEIPPHNRVSFTPDKGMKDHVNREYQYLTYKEIEDEPPPQVEDAAEESEPVIPPEPAIVEPVKEEYKAAVPSPVRFAEPESKGPEEPPPPVGPSHRGKRPDRRYAWIIPAIVIVIAILIIIFYFRACNDRGKGPLQDPDKTETEMPPGEQPEIMPAGDAGVVPVEEETPGEVPGEKTEASPDEEVKVPDRERAGDELLYVLKPGNYLYQLAGQFYGDSLFWVLIYRANEDLIANPEAVIAGSSLSIPALEGDRYNLTRNDSLNLSEGYRMLYEYYMVEQDPGTANFYFGMLRYMPR